MSDVYRNVAFLKSFLCQSLITIFSNFICDSAAINKETNEEVAIKKIGNAFDNRIDAKRTLREIKLLRHLDHENVSKVCHIGLLLQIFGSIHSVSFVIVSVFYIDFLMQLSLCRLSISRI